MNHTITLTADDLETLLAALFDRRLVCIENGELENDNKAAAMYDRLEALRTANE